MLYYIQLQYMSTDRRVYHYRADTLNVSLSIENAQSPTLQLQLTPARGFSTTHLLPHCLEPYIVQNSGALKAYFVYQVALMVLYFVWLGICY